MKCGEWKTVTIKIYTMSNWLLEQPIQKADLTFPLEQILMFSYQWWLGQHFLYLGNITSSRHH